MTTPSAFSEKNPLLQLVWDPTSLKALQFCPTYYNYTIRQGYRGGNNVHLEFGAMFASGSETYKRARAQGVSKADATLAALRTVVEASGNYFVTGMDDDGLNITEWVPWGGAYMDQWRCSGTKPYKNAKGNKAVCPLAHKGVWQFAELPSVCGHCGSETVKENHWIENHKKDRYALVRLMVAYCDEQPETKDGGLFPYTFPDGTAAVELGWRIPLNMVGSTGESFVLAGYFDSIVTYGDEVFIADNKTTTKALTKAYFAGYQPDQQVDTYDLAASILYPTLNVRGVLIEAAQIVAGGGVNLSVQPFYRTEPLREETLEDIERWIDLADEYAQKGEYPMAKGNCWLCVFKSICSLEPGARKRFLEANYEQRPWNPLKERGVVPEGEQS